MLEPRPDLRTDVLQTSVNEELNVAITPLVTTIAPSQAVRLQFGVAGADEPLSPNQGIGKTKVDWGTILGSLTLVVAKTGEAESDEETYETGEPGGEGKAGPLSWLVRRHVVVGAAGIGDGERTAAWTGEERPFGEPGVYRFKLTGTLPPSAAAFETDWIEVTVVEQDGQKSIAELEEVAVAEVRKRFGELSQNNPSRTLPTMEDVEQNRVARFSVSPRHSMNDIDFVEVILSPEGEVRSFVVERFFRCIAAGVQIATPAGPRKVEHVAPGDRVFAYDVDSDRLMTTRVRAVEVTRSDDLVQVAEELVTSVEHPVFADGRWVQARSVRPGSRLLGLDEPARAIARRLERGATVYDLSVEWPHTYFAGDTLVHNKIAPSPEANRMRTDLTFRPSSK